MGRRASKVDFNQSRIVDHFRIGYGCSVACTHAQGKGFPDLVVTFPLLPFCAMLIEIKDGAKPPSARKLTPDQVKFHESWRGKIYIVEKTSDVDALIKEWRGIAQKLRGV